MADSPLHKYPPGVLETLELKVLGQQPTSFGDELTPTFEMLDYYAVDRVVAVNQAGSAGAMPRAALASASQNGRRLLALSGTLTVGAAGGTSTSMSISIVVAGTIVQVGSIAMGVTVPGQVIAVVAVLPAPLVLPPGHFYRTDAYGDAAGADHVCAVRYCYQRLDFVG